MDVQPNPSTPPPPPTTPAKKSNTLVYVLLGCGAIIIIGGLIAMGSIWWGYHKAKGYVEKELGTSSGTNVAQLWSDVPRMEGMDQSQQIDMPTGLKFIAKKMMDTMMRGVNDGKDAGHWDWTAFSLKGKTPADVQTFYTTERMSEHGWKSDGGCTNMPTGTSSDQASFCAFTKQEGQKGTGLLIISAEDKETHAVSIFFIRQEGQGAT
jgi:hypothetical protein